MELTRQALIDKVQSKVTSIEDFNYDKLVAPPLGALLSPYDIDALYNIATSVRYSGNPEMKYRKIDEIMKPRGFVKLSAGTNRIVYRHLESTDFVVKVAADAIGIHDNPKEFENQFIFKPFVTKVFEVSPCGTVGVFERVNPITSREEFLSVADDIYEVITQWFIGKYVLADIGTKFFMNWGIRTYNSNSAGSVAFGPVLLDFPYVYELDGNKLFCSAVDHNSETGLCGGVIDYDDGFNFLCCTKCGVRYRVKELSKKIKNNEVIIKTRRESKKMKIGHYDGNGNIVVDDAGLKTPAKKVTITKQEPKCGSLSINLNGYKQSLSKQEKKEEKAPAANNSLRTNPASSRGMVKAPIDSNFKTTLTKEEEDDEVVKEAYKEIIENENTEYSFSSYDAEYDVVTLTNGTKEITAKLSDIIPEEEKQHIIEASAEYMELDSYKKDVESYKLTAKEKTDEAKKLKAEAKEKDKTIKEQEKIIKELNAQIKNMESTDNAAEDDSVDEISELKAKIESLTEELKAAKTPVNVINGIPREHSTEYVDTSSEFYGEASILNGVVERINGFASPTNKKANRHVIVFPTNEDEGEYLADANQNVIVVTTINGYLIDDLYEAAEEKKKAESKEE